MIWGGDMDKIEILKEYYKNTCTPLIFVNETKLSDNKVAKVYLYDFKEEELENFQSVFQMYLPFYVLNFDMIDNYKLDENIKEELIGESKYIYESHVTPNRKTEINGIFGELFNDYYVKNVLNDEVLLSYLSRKSHSNQESKGIDIVACNIQNEKFEVILSEAKFVGTLSKAKEGLKSDISGDNYHLNENFINDYMHFVMCKQAGLEKERAKDIQRLVTEFNKKKWFERLNFIDCMNQLDYAFKFIYFAIFTESKNRDIENFRDSITEIINEFNSMISETGIKNYDMEVVFIPTYNKSMDLKKKMEDWD